MYDFILYPAFVLAIVFSLWAQVQVSSTYRKYSLVRTSNGRSAEAVADMILRSNGIYDVRIERVRGNLTDHYDPKAKVLRLSDTVYGSSTAAAVGVAAHEAGHAVQHAEKYVPIAIRSMLVPITNFASRISWIIIMGGFLITMFGRLTDFGYYAVLFGIALFAFTAVFQLVTLPCEFNASKRAMVALENCGWYTREELSASRKVLTAAAMTYVAALFLTIMQVLRLLAIFGGRRRN